MCFYEFIISICVWFLGVGFDDWGWMFEVVFGIVSIVWVCCFKVDGCYYFVIISYICFCCLFIKSKRGSKNIFVISNVIG